MFSLLFGRSAKKVCASTPSRKASLNLEGLEDRTVPATFAVTTISDSGVGSLRAAVTQANELAGADQIEIEIAGSDESAAQIVLTSGELAVTDDLTITGEGMERTVVSANRQSRLFNVEGSGKVTLTLQDVSLYKGLAQGEGGAVRLSGAALAATRVNFLYNSADKGGAVSVTDRNGIAGEASFEQSIFNQNSAGTSGGGVYVSSALTPSQGSNVKVTGGNFAYNSVGSGGGGGAGIAVEAGSATIQNSSFASNASQGGGGAIHGGLQSTVSVLGTTITQNAASGGEGGGGVLAEGSLTVSNSTIVGNADTSDEGAGGVNALGVGGVVLSSSILANNTGTDAAVSPDLQTTMSVVSDGHNLVEDSRGVAGLSNTDMTGVDPLLGPLLYNGGGTVSLVPLPGSPVVGAGSNPYRVSTDQRGSGFARVTQGATDIGAVQYNADNAAPTATLTYAPNVTLEGSATSYDFVVQFADDAAINYSTLDALDVVVTGPNGFAQSATLAATDQEANVSPLQGQYSITPTGGAWTTDLNGTYTVALKDNQVFDDKGRPVPGQVLGSFTVAWEGDQLGYVESLYRTVLGRTADADGLAAYTERLDAGESRAAIAQEIWNSSEHRTIQVQDYYRNLLGREAEPEAVQYWTSQLMEGVSEEEMAAAILGSKENTEKASAASTVVDNLYQSILGRTADASQTDYTANLESGAATAEQIAVELVKSEERVGVDVQYLYERLLERPADEGGEAYFVDMAKTQGIENVVTELLASDEFYKRHGSHT